jgi:hypothetical protein
MLRSTKGLLQRLNPGVSVRSLTTRSALNLATKPINPMEAGAEWIQIEAGKEAGKSVIGFNPKAQAPKKPVLFDPDYDRHAAGATHIQSGADVGFEPSFGMKKRT